MPVKQCTPALYAFCHSLFPFASSFSRRRPRQHVPGRVALPHTPATRYPALRGLDDRADPFACRRGAARVEAVEAALPGDVAVRVELDREHARARAGRRQWVELAGRHVTAVARGLHCFQVSVRACERDEQCLPLHSPAAVELEDQRAGTAVRIAVGADSDEASIARLLDVPERGLGCGRRVDPRPGQVASRVELHDQPTRLAGQVRTDGAELAVPGPAGDDAAAVDRLLQRGAKRVAAGRGADAADLFLPLRIAVLT